MLVNGNNPYLLAIYTMRELVEGAKLCLEYQKDPNEWAKTSGGLAFAAGIQLFSFVDAYGSFFRRRKDFKIRIESGLYTINKPSQHFYILNSEYFSCNFTRKGLAVLYEIYRSPTVHNALLPPQCIMAGGKFDGPLFENNVVPQSTDDTITLNVRPLLVLCTSAYEKFIPDAEDILSKSKVLDELVHKVTRPVK